jgi:hypothetical protein
MTVVDVGDFSGNRDISSRGASAARACDAMTSDAEEWYPATY